MLLSLAAGVYSSECHRDGVSERLMLTLAWLRCQPAAAGSCLLFSFAASLVCVHLRVYMYRYVKDQCDKLLLCRLAASADTLINGDVFVARHKEQILPVFLIHYRNA